MRKLASIQRITEMNPIPDADAIEVAKILGWRVVVKKVENFKVGDLVVINPIRYAKMKHKEGSLKDGVITDNAVVGYDFPILLVNDMPCLYIYDSDVDFVIKEYEEVDASMEIIEETPEIV
jgi:hypothetical protein